MGAQKVAGGPAPRAYGATRWWVWSSLHAKQLLSRCFFGSPPRRAIELFYSSISVLTESTAAPKLPRKDPMVGVHRALQHLCLLFVLLSLAHASETNDGCDEGRACCVLPRSVASKKWKSSLRSESVVKVLPHVEFGMFSIFSYRTD